jgi:hypothetical protein
MKEFPSLMTPDRAHLFRDLVEQRLSCYLRRDIYEFVTSRASENEYFDLDKFSVERGKNITLVREIAKKIILELQKLGWKCKTSFGCTGLFIYSTENPPPNCFED